jgi:hypothetical protein
VLALARDGQLHFRAPVTQRSEKAIRQMILLIER